MKVLVTGVKGQLGYDVVNELEKRGHTAIGTDVEEMDITDEGKVREVLSAEKPDAVIHQNGTRVAVRAEDGPYDPERGSSQYKLIFNHFMEPELFEKMLRSAARDANVSLREVEVRKQSPDHPILWNVPETEYLKFYIFQIV